MTITPTPVLAPVYFDAPLLNPSPGGLYPATLWTEIGTDEPSRHLNGVEIRPTGNYGGELASGVWEAAWCGEPTPGQLKEGDRPDGLAPFEAITVWAFDSCDLTEPSRTEVQQRAAQIMRLREPVMVAREFAERLKLDATALVGGALPQVADPVAALAVIEGAFAQANTLGFLHLSPEWLPVLASAQVLTRSSSGGGFITPGGHRLILDGGYVDGLDSTIVATSQPFGWRDQVQLRTAIDERHNLYVAVVERTVLIGYEAVVAAVEIVPEP